MSRAPTISRSAQLHAARASSAAARIALGVITILLAIAILFRWDRQLHSLEDTPSRVLLSLLGMSVGAWMLRVLSAGARRLRKTFIFGTLAILISQVCYHGIVWNEEWKRATFTWRVWWLSILVALLTTHLVWLHFVGNDQLKLRRLAITFATIATAMWTIICLGTTPLPDLPAWYLLTAAVATAASVIASITPWLRMRHRRGQLFTRWVKVSWFIGAQVAVAAIAFYVGRATAPIAGSVDSIPSAIASMTSEELDAQLTADLKRLHVVADGLDELSKRVDTDAIALRDKLAGEKRTYFTPAEEDRIRAHFMSYLAYRAALLRLAATYGNYASVRDPALRAKCFLVAYASGATVYDASLRLVKTYADDRAARTKLNEPDTASGIAPNTFDRIEEAVVADANVELFDNAGKYFDENAARWRRANILPADQLTWLENRINLCRAYVMNNRAIDPTDRAQRFARRVGRDIYEPYYAASSLVSTLIGDTRMVGRPPFIDQSQIATIREKLQPGDIFLERRNWFASNAFLPGFWPHAALYVGRIHDLERLGLVRRDEDGKWTSDDPNIRDRLEEFVKHAHDGGAHSVIESVSEGVIFNSIEESMHADYVAVLRPRLTDQQKAQAIARAFAHVGKPYDFEFDFFSADKLVCTELVYRSYEGLLHFELVKIMGRDTLPALEICKKFIAEREFGDGDVKRQLDFVLFLDAVPAKNTARFATEDEFCESAARPRGFNE